MERLATCCLLTMLAGGATPEVEMPDRNRRPTGNGPRTGSDRVGGLHQAGSTGAEHASITDFKPPDLAGKLRDVDVTVGGPS